MKKKIKMSVRAKGKAKVILDVPLSIDINRGDLSGAWDLDSEMNFQGRRKITEMLRELGMEVEQGDYWIEEDED
jgi:hypothetical protein